MGSMTEPGTNSIPGWDASRKDYTICTAAKTYESASSDEVPVASGVPQGSVLGPCLFLFYINDIAVGLSSTVRLFADDTLLYLTVQNNNDAELLQQTTNFSSLNCFRNSLNKVDLSSYLVLG